MAGSKVDLASLAVSATFGGGGTRSLADGAAVTLDALAADAPNASAA